GPDLSICRFLQQLPYSNAEHSLCGLSGNAVQNPRDQFLWRRGRHTETSASTSFEVSRLPELLLLRMIRSCWFRRESHRSTEKQSYRDQLCSTRFRRHSGIGV